MAENEDGIALPQLKKFFQQNSIKYENSESTLYNNAADYNS